MSRPLPNQPAPVLDVPKSVFEVEGPIVSVYLNTRGALADAAAQVQLRWKNARRTLVNDGAPEAALEAIEPLLTQAHAAGETIVAIASSTGVLYTAHLPELPDHDIAVVGVLPHLIPLITSRQRMLPHLVVAIDRVGAEIVAVLPDRPDRQIDVSGNDLHVTRSAPGGWSQRRFQQRAENRWEENARLVADELVQMADATDPRLIIISGDVRSVAFLRDHLPTTMAGILAEVQGDYGSVDEALLRSQQLISDLADRDTTDLLASFDQEAGQNAHSQFGPEVVLEALSNGRASTVILDPEQAGGQTAWFGPDLSQASATAEGLLSRGVTNPVAAPLLDIVVRAAAGTDAGIWIASAPQLSPTGIGVMLRF